MDSAKAPDRKFKDFRNHVLHVSDNYWGGAIPAAELWYARLVEQLTAKDWQRAVYCAGVLSHYVTDPLMPLHTGQTEDEAQVHRFIEWGTARIYEQLVATHDAARSLVNWKSPEYAISDDWLALLVIEGAELSHEHYDVMIDHYDPAIGHKQPEAGFDDTCKTSLAKLLGWSIRTNGIRPRSGNSRSQRCSAQTIAEGINSSGHPGDAVVLDHSKTCQQGRQSSRPENLERTSGDRQSNSVAARRRQNCSSSACRRSIEVISGRTKRSAGSKGRFTSPTDQRTNNSHCLCNAYENTITEILSGPG